MRQLALPLTHTYIQTFENLIISQNITTISIVQDRIQKIIQRQQQHIYIWGVANSGCTHVLKACCQVLLGENIHCGFFSAKETLHPQLIATHDYDCLVIDDVEATLTQPDAQEQLMHIFNAAQDSGCSLLLSSAAPPKKMSILLDLQTRLSSMLIVRMHPLNQADLQQFIEHSSQARGFTIDHKVISYILKHCDRSVAALLDIVEQLDVASLQQQRNITIQLTKEVLDIGTT